MYALGEALQYERLKAFARSKLYDFFMRRQNLRTFEVKEFVEHVYSSLGHSERICEDGDNALKALAVVTIIKALLYLWDNAQKKDWIDIAKGLGMGKGQLGLQVVINCEGVAKLNEELIVSKWTRKAGFAALMKGFETLRTKQLSSQNSSQDITSIAGLAGEGIGMDIDMNMDAIVNEGKTKGSAIRSRRAELGTLL